MDGHRSSNLKLFERDIPQTRDNTQTRAKTQTLGFKKMILAKNLYIRYIGYGVNFPQRTE